MEKKILNTNRKLMNYKKSIGCVLGGVLIVLSCQDYLQAKEKSFKVSANYKINWESYSGKITDSEGEPLVGVSIAVKGSKSGTVTDINGNFSINVPEGSTLVISYLGFETKEVVTGKNAVLNIKLSQSQNSLDEVVTVGYGTKKRSDINGSIATIDAKTIEDLPVPNIAAALRNRIPGVGINTVSGKPGSSITINIRNSFSSESAQANGVTDEPLYVIDGLIATKEDFDNIDPTLVENISFLKDASAAIYGAAGAKGVILITTKKGHIGKPTITYNGYRGFSDAATTPKMLSAYQQATLLNDGYALAGKNYSYFFSEADLKYLKNHQEQSWYDALWGVSHLDRHTINVSGGTDKITFFAGGNYYDESGNYGGIDYKKYGIRTGMQAKIIDGLTTNLSINTDYSKKFSNTYKNGGENDQSYFQQLITTPRWVPIQINGLPVNFNGKTNALAVVEAGNAIESKDQGVSVNASIDYAPKFIKGLTAHFQYGKSQRAGVGRQYVPAYTVYDFAMTGNNSQLFRDSVIRPQTAVGAGNTQLRTENDVYNSYQLIGSLNYGLKTGKHDFSVMAAFDQSQNETDQAAVYWRNQLIPNVAEYWAFDQSTFTNQSNTAFQARKRSYISRLNYAYDGKYSLEAIARYDASTNFAPSKRWGLFPSVGLGWKVSDENFFKDNVKFIDYLKIRASYGLVGEDRVNERLWQSRYTSDNDGYLYNQSFASGLNPQLIPNPDISWEKSKVFNIGGDATMLNGRLSLTTDFYTRKNYDVFDTGNAQNFPMYAGFAPPVVNYGERISWGSEFSIGYHDKISKDWGYSADINFGFSNSRTISKFYDEFQLFANTYPDLKYDIGTDPRRYNNNNFGLISLGILKTQADLDALLNKYPNYTINKVTPQVGWLYYEDTDGDGKITEHDQVLMFNKTTPVVGFGINLGVSYKALSLKTNIVLRIGGKEFYDNKSKEPSTTTTNVASYWADHWTPQNPDAKFPRSDDPSVDAGWNSTFWAVDGTMCRINNMTLTYTLPKRFTSKLGLSNVRAVATGNNLWTIINPLPYKDPYSSYIYDYPTLRTISFGLSVGL
nr:TonB-dependent receptor [uncultured Pedobacter sp.]